MKKMTFILTVEVERLSEINIQYLEDQVSRSVLSDEFLELGPQDEMGATAKLIQVSEIK